jgi:hypothetical protein
MATIGSRVSTVASLLGGRTDLNTNISGWIANTYRDLANSIPFETLEATQAPTPCVPNSDTLDYPPDARAIKSITMGFPVGLPTSQRPLYKRNAAIIDRYATTPTGVPSIWAPFGSQIVLRQVPDQPYPLTIRYWLKVTLDPTAAVGVINATVINLPDDWLEIVDYGSQMRGYMDLQEPDKAMAIRTLLYGDPGNRKKNPGIIKQRLTRIQAEYMDSNYGVRPRLTRYTYVR